MRFLENSLPSHHFHHEVLPFSHSLPLCQAAGSHLASGFGGIPLLWGWGAPLCTAWPWATPESSCQAEQEGWHSLAGGLRRCGSGPPTLQQSNVKGTSLTRLGGSLQKAAVLALLDIPKAQPLLSGLSEGQGGSTQHQRKEAASFALSPLRTDQFSSR